jgi:hypothetical protein
MLSPGELVLKPDLAAAFLKLYNYLTDPGMTFQPAGELADAIAAFTPEASDLGLASATTLSNTGLGTSSIIDPSTDMLGGSNLSTGGLDLAPYSGALSIGMGAVQLSQGNYPGGAASLMGGALALAGAGPFAIIPSALVALGGLLSKGLQPTDAQISQSSGAALAAVLRAGLDADVQKATFDTNDAERRSLQYDLAEMQSLRAYGPESYSDQLISAGLSTALPQWWTAPGNWNFDPYFRTIPGNYYGAPLHQRDVLNYALLSDDNRYPMPIQLTVGADSPLQLQGPERDALLALVAAEKAMMGNSGSGGNAAGIIGMTAGPTQMLVGEAGTEAVAVIRNPRQVDLAAAGGQGGTTVINLTINHSGDSYGVGGKQAFIRDITNSIRQFLKQNMGGAQLVVN